MAKLKLDEGFLDRLFKTAERKINKMKRKNASKMLNDPKFKKELSDFTDSLKSLEDTFNDF